MIWSQDNWTIGTSGMGLPDDRQFDCQRVNGFIPAALIPFFYSFFIKHSVSLFIRSAAYPPRTMHECFHQYR